MTFLLSSLVTECTPEEDRGGSSAQIFCDVGDNHSGLTEQPPYFFQRTWSNSAIVSDSTILPD